MTLRIRFLITALFLCHQLPASSLVTSQLLAENSGQSSDVSGSKRPAKKPACCHSLRQPGRKRRIRPDHHLRHLAGKRRRHLQAARQRRNPLPRLRPARRRSHLQLRQRRGHRLRSRHARRRPGRRPHQGQPRNLQPDRRNRPLLRRDRNAPACASAATARSSPRPLPSPSPGKLSRSRAPITTSFTTAPSPPANCRIPNGSFRPARSQWTSAATPPSTTAPSGCTNSRFSTFPTRLIRSRAKSVSPDS